MSSEGLRPSDSPLHAPSLAAAPARFPPALKLRRTRRSAFGVQAGRSRGSLATLALFLAGSL